MKKKEAIPTAYVLGLIIVTPEMKTVPKPSCCENCNQSNPTSDSCSQKHLQWAFSSQSHRKHIQMSPGDRQKSHYFFFIDSQTIPCLIPSLNTYAGTYLTSWWLQSSRLGLQAYLLALYTQIIYLISWKTFRGFLRTRSNSKLKKFSYLAPIWLHFPLCH